MFYSSTGQSSQTGGTGVYCENTDSGVTNNITTDTYDKSKIKFVNTGIYNIQFRIQFNNNQSVTEHTVGVWVKKSSTNIANSNSLFTVPKDSNGGDLIASLNFFVKIASVNDDTIQIMWAPTDDTNHISIIAYDATGPYPATPSVIITAEQIA